MEDPAAVYNQATQDFEAGQWQAAIDGFNRILAAVTDPKQTTSFGPLYFTLGAAYYNLPDFKKSIATFKLYLEKFPRDPNANEVRLALGRAYYADKDYENANKTFIELTKAPQYRDQALVAVAQCFKEMQKPDEAIRALEELISPDIRNQTQSGGAVTLMQMYAEKGESKKALDLFNKLKTKLDVIDNILGLNTIGIEIGDKLAETREFDGALAIYRGIMTQEEIVAAQKLRIASMSRRMEATLKAATGNAQLMAGAVSANAELAVIRDAIASAMTEFEKSTSFTPAVLFRQGRCWYDMGKPWESLVVFDRIMNRYPAPEQREPALYAMITVLGELNQTKRCLDLCQIYLKDFPTGPNADMVGYLTGAVAMQSGDPVAAETFFGISLDTRPESTYKEQMRFLLGNARFMQGKYDDAKKDYEAYLRDYPTGENSEEAAYRLALIPLFSANYEEATGALNAYVAKYPEGAFVSDAGYRLMVAKYANAQYDQVIADSKAWRGKNPGDAMEAEVLSLTADTLVAQDKAAEAVPLYIESYKKATTDEVLNYSLFEASKTMQKLGQWDKVSAMFEEFVKEKPNHPAVVTAMFWIAKARAREGRQEDAKQFLVDTLKQYIDQPHRESVEQLLTQLATLCAKRPQPPKDAKPATPAAVVADTAPSAGASSADQAASASVPAPLPPPPPFDASAELEKQLVQLHNNTSPIAQARLIYCRSELMLLKKKTVEREALLQTIADQFQPNQLSPVLLATIGDYLLAKGQTDKAAALYTELMNGYPQSDYLDFAYVGLGQIAFDKKEYEKALPLFTHAADVLAAGKVKDATVGKARTLLELGKYDEAKKLFELVSGVKEWRGESTALALYSLGDLEERQGRWQDAIARYQRVFVLYQRYLPWVAKAYIGSAQAFDKLGERPKAVAHLREMLKNEKLANLPETEQAKKMLREWGEQV